MTSITRVIKDLIDANTIATIQEEIANGTATVGITNVIYTDENYANTANDYIANTSTHGHIKILGYGFLPNANVVLSLVSDRTNTEILLDYSNTYYVNFKELRAEIENSQELTAEYLAEKKFNNFSDIVGNLSNSYLNIFVINENGTNTKKINTIKFERQSVGYGWFGGGTPIGSIVDRIYFNSDTGTASVRGPLSLARSGLAATGNQNYGWFGGGSPGPLSTIDRIDFAADTGTASVRGPLSLTRFSLAATGNDNYGWFGGGTPGVISIVDRIDFAADTGTASVRGPLSLARSGLAATGNQNYGWFGGGSPGPLSTIDRITFSADTATASVRGPLSLARLSLTATGNQNYGWFGGGDQTPAPSSYSRIDRIDFSADTETASVRGSLNVSRNSLTAISDNNYGWFAGGKSATQISLIDRITFSADTATASVRGPLSSTRYNLDSVSSFTS